MRTLRLLILAALLSPAAGCTWLDNMRAKIDRRPTGSGKIEPVSAEQLAKYLDDRAAALQSLEYENVRMRVSGKGILGNPVLEGSLASAQPKNFRMVSSHRLASSAKVDLGSNIEQFWIYVSAPGGDPPTYVFASHTDFETGRAKLPGIPFEPGWVMQALGMASFPPTNEYHVDVNEKDRSYVLWWPATMPGAGPVRKEVWFAADRARDPYPQVKKHVVRDEKGKELASAEVKAAQTVPAGAVYIQYPTHVVLNWTVQDFKMDLTLEKAQVNQLSAADAQRLFTRPTIQGTRPIDLAGGVEFLSPGR